MTHAIIGTKLMPTFVSPHLLPRERLIERLQANASARLLVVQGEAGAGKSSLLYEFARRARTPIAWYSLQETDRETKIFLTCLCETLGRAFPGSVRRGRDLLENTPSVDAIWQDVVIAIINDLIEYGHPTTVVLDDFHEVQDTRMIADIVAFLVRNGPANLQVILATRTTFDLALPYLRSKGLLVEVGGEELCFTPQEVEQVFRDIWGIPVDRDTARLLHEKTEGWVTGLQLVSQAVRGRGGAELRPFVEGLRGKEPFIYDYLAREVYALQPAEVREFLKHTSILARFNAEMAQAVTGSDRCEERLHYLETHRLFLVHLGADREWFRYHHLFADFLRLKLALEDGTERSRQLHLKAAAWLEAHDEPAAAIPHFLEGSDPHSVVRVLNERGATMLSAGLQRSLAAWIDRLPRDLRGGSAGVTVLRADLCDLGGDWARAVELYERAVRQLRREERAGELARVLESLMLCLLRYGQTDRVVKICQEALAHADAGDIAQRASLEGWLGAILVYSGRDWDLGYELIRSGHQLAYQSGDPRAIAQACVTYGFAYHFPQGNFQHAEQAFNEGIELFRSLGWTPTFYWLQMYKSVVVTFRGHFERARELVEDNLAVAERAGHAFIVCALELNRAMLYSEMLDFHRAGQAISRLNEGLVPAQLRPWYFRTLMWIHTMQDNREPASVAAEEMMRILAVNGRGMYAPECLVALGYHYLRGREFDTARRMLTEALDLAERGRCRYWRMKAHLRLAAVDRESGRDSEMLRHHLHEALVLSRDNHYDDTWLADPTDLALPLLVDAVRLHVEEPYARSLLRCWGETQPARLLPFVNHVSAHVRSAVLDLLGRVETPAVVDLLRAARRDPSKRVRATAAKRLKAQAPSRVKVEVLCLGQFQILRNGEPLVLTRRLTQSIFKFLLSRYDAHTPVEVLTEHFWPEVTPDKAKRNLIVQVNVIRKLIHPESQERSFLITLHPEGYTLQLDGDVWLDLAEFDRLFREGTALRLQGDLDAADAKFLRAEALCRGAFLETDVYDDGLKHRRERVAQQYRGAIHFLAERAMDSDRAGEAVSWYRKQMARDSLDEATLQNLLRCYVVTADRTSARRDYDAFARTLHEEMALQPSAETKALMDRLQLLT